MSVAPEPLPHAAVRIEDASRARFSTRIAHRVCRATVRPILDAIASLGAQGPLRGDPAFRVANFAELAALPLRAPRGTRRRCVQFADFRAEWLWHKSIDGPHNPAGGALLYFHGGAYVAGGLHSHRRLAARIAQSSGMPLLNVAYRQLPTAHITGSLEDAVHAYRHLLEEGFPPSRIVFAGDSAGGGLAFLAALAIQDRGLPMPGGIAAIAPFSDLDPTRRRSHANASLDPLLTGFVLSVPALIGMARGGELDPAWSAVNHDFTGLPPVFMQVGSTEILLADAEQLADCCARAGVPCTLQIWDRAIHDFHVLADILPDARAAVAELGRFTRTCHLLPRSGTSVGLRPAPGGPHTEMAPLESSA